MSRSAAASKKKPIPAATKRSTTPNSVDSHEDIEIRTIKKPEYRSFRLSKPIKHPKPRIAGSLSLFKESILLLFKRKRLFLGLLAVYMVLLIVLVRGFGGSELTANLSQLQDQLINADVGKVASGLTIISVLIGAANNSQGEAASLFRAFLLLVISLAAIWALRQTRSGVKVGPREAFYEGIYPMVPFLAVLAIIAIQTTPMLIANFLYKILFSTGLAVSGLEQILWGFLLFLLVLWSLYMLSSSIFALYISTLPKMKPIQALKHAKGLVRYRRWTVMRRVLFLPLVLIVLLVVLVYLTMTILPNIVNPIFFVYTSSTILIVHSYYYNLYRELIK